MKRHIAVAASLLIVGWMFLGNSFSPVGSNSLFERFSLFPASASTPELVPVLPGSDFEDSSVPLLAWSVFQEYLGFAREHDLEGLTNISYQISPTCTDPLQRLECEKLMDGVYGYAKNFDYADFSIKAYDDKQVVLATPYLQEDAGAEEVQTVLFFVRGEDGSPKMLGIKVCEGAEFIGNLLGLKCVNTNPETRDADGNGWWNDIEFFFKK